MGMCKTRLNARRVNYFTTILQCERTQVSCYSQCHSGTNHKNQEQIASTFYLRHQITSTNSQDTLCGPTSVELKVNQTHWNTYGSAHQISLISIEKSPFSQLRKGKARLKLLQPVHREFQRREGKTENKETKTR
jgi:hypothetical protein